MYGREISLNVGWRFHPINRHFHPPPKNSFFSCYYFSVSYSFVKLSLWSDNIYVVIHNITKWFFAICKINGKFYFKFQRSELFWILESPFKLFLTVIYRLFIISDNIHKWICIITTTLFGQYRKESEHYEIVIFKIMIQSSPSQSWFFHTPHVQNVETVCWKFWTDISIGKILIILAWVQKSDETRANWPSCGVVNFSWLLIWSTALTSYGDVKSSEEPKSMY